MSRYFKFTERDRRDRRNGRVSIKCSTFSAFSTYLVIWSSWYFAIDTSDVAVKVFWWKITYKNGVEMNQTAFSRCFSGAIFHAKKWYCWIYSTGNMLCKKKVLRQNPGEKIERESILLIYKNVVINIERLIVVGLDSSQGICHQQFSMWDHHYHSFVSCMSTVSLSTVITCKAAKESWFFSSPVCHFMLVIVQRIWSSPIE